MISLIEFNLGINKRKYDLIILFYILILIYKIKTLIKLNKYRNENL